jgi:hypothetical protein
MKKTITNLCLLILAASSGALLAQGGGDSIEKLGALKDLLGIIDSGLFHWVARLMAGLCILSAGWALKEQKFSVAVVCLLGAMLFGTAVKWVKNVFSMGGDAKGVFEGGMLEERKNLDKDHLYVLAESLVKGVRNA